MRLDYYKSIVGLFRGSTFELLAERSHVRFSLNFDLGFESARRRRPPTEVRRVRPRRRRRLRRHAVRRAAVRLRQQLPERPRVSDVLRRPDVESCQQAMRR